MLFLLRGVPWPDLDEAGLQIIVFSEDWPLELI